MWGSTAALEGRAVEGTGRFQSFARQTKVTQQPFGRLAANFLGCEAILFLVGPSGALLVAILCFG